MENKNKKEVSRRDFLRTGAAAVGTAAAMSVVLPNCTPTLAQTESEAEQAANGETIPERVTEELSIPEMPEPDMTEYECDVLVIGGGYAGLNAAIAAAESGCQVVLVDKGTPGYAGLSPWAGTHAWFDPDYDDRDAIRESIIRGGEFMCNQTWLDIWLDESKTTKERLEEWGLLDQYDRASDIGEGEYWNNSDYVGYQNDVVAPHDRHARFMSLLEEKGVTVITHTMITKVDAEDNQVRGAIGFYVPTATPMEFHAKSVIMCMGQGAFKVQGWPAAADTFDGECIAYDLGLAICNKETEDYHSTATTLPGQTFMVNAWSYLENFFYCGLSDEVDPDDPNAYSRNQQMYIYLNTNYKDGQPLVTSYSHRKGGTITSPEDNGGDVRTGKAGDGNWSDGVNANKKTGGASPGFCGHLMPGVHCDWDDECGFTGINGLYVAGDGMNASPPNGFGYGNIHGMTTNFVSTQGYHAGNAAAEYVQTVDLQKIPEDVYEAEAERILLPLNRAANGEDCFDATWCFNVLSNIMTPYFAVYEKTDATLEAALQYVERLRDDVVPILGAANPHDLRLCHEAANKVTSAEMKLRASLARKESRGFCFHKDYQYRKDDEFLCMFGCVKQEDGTMGVESFPLPDEWKGDVDEDYNTRYPNPFPNEEEDLKKIGIYVTRPEAEKSK